MRVTDKHVFFFTYKDIFSNHYRCQEPFWLYKHEKDGVKFWTVEHYMMYEKAMLFGNFDIAKEIAETYHPQSAKALGRQVKNFNNDMWEEYRESIIINGLLAKMMHNKAIQLAALRHRHEGRDFVEASPFDAIWGIKMGENDPLVDDPANWKGLNLLGKCWNKATDSMRINWEVD